MLLVNTYVGNSAGHGLGLFASERIRLGTLVWEFNLHTSQAFWNKQFIAICKDMSLPTILEFLEHSYMKGGHIFYRNDDCKFINHSDNANTSFHSNDFKIATRDIEKGEEITENYYCSYDNNNFFTWNLNGYRDSKSELISFLKRQLKLNSLLKSAK